MGNLSTEEEPENANEYFDLISKKIENESKIASNQIINKESKLKKNWKNVILHFLDKQNKRGITWCKELYNLIKNYPFISEKKFIDEFFWQRFEMRTKPDCLNKNYRAYFLSSYLTKVINHNLSLTEEKKNLYNSDMNLRVSLSSSQYLSQLSKAEYEQNKEKLKEYINIFKKHIQNIDHPISICIKLFVEIFSGEIKVYTEEIEDIKDIREKMQRARIITEALCQKYKSV